MELEELQLDPLSPPSYPPIGGSDARHPLIASHLETAPLFTMDDLLSNHISSREKSGSKRLEIPTEAPVLPRAHLSDPFETVSPLHSPKHRPSNPSLPLSNKPESISNKRRPLSWIESNTPCKAQGSRLEQPILSARRAMTAIDLATDMSENFHIGVTCKSAQIHCPTENRDYSPSLDGVPTVRRSLFKPMYSEHVTPPLTETSPCSNSCDNDEPTPRDCIKFAPQLRVTTNFDIPSLDLVTPLSIGKGSVLHSFTKAKTVKAAEQRHASISKATNIDDVPLQTPVDSKLSPSDAQNQRVKSASISSSSSTLSSHPPLESSPSAGSSGLSNPRRSRMNRMNICRSSFDVRLHNDNYAKKEGEHPGSACWPPPPTKVRRTQSMFATPDQLLHEQISETVGCSSLSEPYSLLSQPKCELPSFTVQQDPFRRISLHTMCDLLDGRYSYLFPVLRIVDCRFEYEYEGGHITGAINISSKPKLEKELLPNASEIQDSSSPQSIQERTLIVFHCEYSAYRGPIMAAHLRHCDRAKNSARYPYLDYPDIVILDGGYSSFYKEHMSRCFPQSYVGMNDSLHQSTCEREMSQFRNLSRPKSRKMIPNSSSVRKFCFPARPFASFMAHSNDSSIHPFSESSELNVRKD